MATNADSKSQMKIIFSVSDFSFHDNQYSTLTAMDVTHTCTYITIHLSHRHTDTYVALLLAHDCKYFLLTWTMISIHRQISRLATKREVDCGNDQTVGNGYAIWKPWNNSQRGTQGEKQCQIHHGQTAQCATIVRMSICKSMQKLQITMVPFSN